MTSRERVGAAAEHREPDRVPIDPGSHPSSGISALACARLKTEMISGRDGATILAGAAGAWCRPSTARTDVLRIAPS